MSDGFVLVTGASGYIAGFTIRQLLAEGWSVRGTVRSLSRAREVREAIGASEDELPLFTADLMSEAGWAEAMDGADFATLLDEHRLSLDLDALTPFARWKPAFKHARIFDTLFLLAEAGDGAWQPRHQPGECEAAFWISAIEALAMIERGEASAIFPTKRNLERIAQYGTIADARAAAAAYPIDCITPWIEEMDGAPHVRIPEGLGYPVIAEPLATAFRA